MLPIPSLPMVWASQYDAVKNVWGFVDRTMGVPREAMDYLSYRLSFDTSAADRDLQRVGLPCPSLRDYLPNLVGWARTNLLEGTVDE